MVQCKMIVGLIVRSVDTILFVRYASARDGQTGWFLPDDLINEFEHPDDAARRVLGTKLGLGEVAPKLNHIESFKGRDQSWHLAFHYLAHVERPEHVTLSADLAEMRWFALGKLPPRADIAHHGWALSVLTRAFGD
ncbi:MAG: NUDIX domain-containing protein [Alphaproteobacteria bacterium]|nr:NUDIX domain-containing protein [Alphaproteobacteria bacterium]